MREWCKARTVKEWLAMIALLASIGGAAVLTLNRIWLIRILETAKAWADIADIAKLDTVIIGAIILALGFAINRRTIKLSKDGLEASGGADN
jgi:Flp pilus assembly protein CpaB